MIIDIEKKLRRNYHYRDNIDLLQKSGIFNKEEIHALVWWKDVFEFARTGEFEEGNKNLTFRDGAKFKRSYAVKLMKDFAYRYGDASLYMLREALIRHTAMSKIAKNVGTEDRVALQSKLIQGMLLLISHQVAGFINDRIYSGNKEKYKKEEGVKAPIIFKDEEPRAGFERRETAFNEKD